MTTSTAATRALVERRAPGPIAAALERGLDEAARLPTSALARLVLPADVAPAAALLRLGDDAMLWEARDDDATWAGVGAAATLTGDHAMIGGAIARRANAILARLVTLGDAPPPRWFGGVSFAPGSADHGAWSAFGDVRFTLPRWTYVRTGDRAQLLLTVSPSDIHDRAALHAELAAIVDGLTAPCPTSTAAVVRQHDVAQAAWFESVASIRAAIAGGQVKKVVAARSRTVDLTRAIDPAAVMIELGRRQPACTRFALRHRGVSFVGATPERLIRRRGSVIDSEAVAGSRARVDTDDSDAAALWGDAKDRFEHDLVVRTIEAVLRPRCRELAVPPQPVVRRWQQILHLHTPIAGELDGDHHILELLAALHPTPAVGGTPTADAVAWIVAHEVEARGWYASPVGWFDGRGDGEFAVAIRSGLLAGASARLYAGAGIVSASEPSAEWDETELKLRVLSGALGLEPGR